MALTQAAIDAFKRANPVPPAAGGGINYVPTQAPLPGETAPGVIPTLGAPPEPPVLAPGDLASQRGMAAMLLAKSQQPVTDIAGGFAGMAEALAGGDLARKAGKRETAALEGAQAQDEYKRNQLGQAIAGQLGITDPNMIAAIGTDPATMIGLLKKEAPEYGFTTVNGQVVRTNKGTGSVEPAYTAPDETDPDLLEYRQALEAGEIPADMTLTEYTATKTKPLLSIDQRAENAGDVAMAGLNAKKYDSLQSAAMGAQETLGMYDAAEQALAAGGYTGFAGEGVLAAQRLAVALGIGDEETIKQTAGNELLTAIQNKMALMMRNPDTGLGMPGALSDKDIAFLKDAQIGISRTPAGNKLMLEVGRRVEQRKIEIANLYDQWLDGELDGPNADGTPHTHSLSDRGFGKIVRSYAEHNPMFADLMGAEPETAPPADTGANIPGGLDKGGKTTLPDGTTIERVE